MTTKNRRRRSARSAYRAPSKKMIDLCEQYNLKGFYSKGGSGIAVVRADLDGWRVTFSGDSESLSYADGRFDRHMDGGHFAEEWRFVDEEFRCEFGDKFFSAVTWLLENFPRVEEYWERDWNRRFDEYCDKLEGWRASLSAEATVAKIVRNWLKERNIIDGRGRGLAGDRVILHPAKFDQKATIVFEGTSWAWDFADAANWAPVCDNARERPFALLGRLNIEVDPLSSYEIEVEDLS